MIKDSNGDDKTVTRVRDVNLFDCIGFCDTVLKPEDVLKLIKDKVKVNCVKVSMVLIVTSGRLRPSSAAAI